MQNTIFWDMIVGGVLALLQNLRETACCAPGVFHFLLMALMYPFWMACPKTPEESA